MNDPLALTQVRLRLDRIHAELLNDIEEAKAAARKHPRADVLLTWIDDVVHLTERPLEEANTWAASMELDRRLNCCGSPSDTLIPVREIVGRLLEYSQVYRLLNESEQRELARARARVLLPEFSRRLPGAVLAVGG